MTISQDRLTTEIAHVLFLDIVGYSRRPMEEQTRLFRELHQLVPNMPEFRRARERNELLCLDTGDGMALVFFRDPLSPAQCAIEIARALTAHPELQVRMGIHSGPVTRETDVNGKENVAGNGMNMAQRVMDCGDAGHILVSHSSAEFLGQFETWASALHDLGECEVKHGARLHLFNLYVEETGNPALPLKLRAAPPQSAAHAPGNAATEKDVGWIEPAGGAVPLGSPFYIERHTDAQFKAAIARRDSLVLVKGPRQVGKTSLLARGLQQARAAGTRVVLTDLQKLTAPQLASAEALFEHLAELIADQLDLDASLDAVWNPRRSWNVNFERFLRRDILGASGAPVVWALDEVDRLFACSFGSEVFGLFRSWHNERALNPDGPWARLTLAIAYATEAHLFITDLNQSPFNVGTRLTLEDFTLADVEALNLRYGSPLQSAADMERFYGLLGGHPYLTRRGLEELVTGEMEIATLEQQADREKGPFGDHLRRILHALTQDAHLVDIVHGLLKGEPCIDTSGFYRLRSAGIVIGETTQDARLRCRLYAIYLQQHLG